MIATITFTTDPYLDAVTFVLMIATGVLAYKTWQLHSATVALAKDTVEATTLADRHHQESLSPLCVIRDVAWQSDERGQRIILKIHNQGNGPAVQVKCTVTPRMEAFERSQDALTIRTDSLQAGEQTPLSRPSPYFGQTFEMAVVHLEYMNQFGEWGRSRWTVFQNQEYRLDALDLPAPKNRI